MGKLYSVLDDKLRSFIAAQRLFFVATAPSGDGGHVNMSPKGLDSFAVLDEESVAYLDFVGSGAETIAHLRQNGRICIMFCAFDGSPNILRLYGDGVVIEPGDAEFPQLRSSFTLEDAPVVRSIIRVKLERIADACGYGVPLYSYLGPRTQLAKFGEKLGPQGMLDYQREKNGVSIDGLPALRWTETSDIEEP